MLLPFHLILLGLGLIPLQAFAATPSSDLKLFLYEDKSDTLSIDQIREIDRKGEFVAQETLGRKGFGFTRSAVWVKFVKEYEDGENHFFLGSPRPDFTTMDVYVYDSSGRPVSFQAMGTHSKERDLKTRLPVGRLTFPGPDTYTIFVKIKCGLQLSLSLYLVNEQEYLRVATNEANFFFLYYGTMIGLLLYNFCLFLILRYRDYIFYTLFGIAMLLNAYVQGGFAEVSPIAIPGLSSIDDSMRVLFLPCITSLLFTISFLNLKRLSPRLTRVMLGIATLAAGLQIVLWFDKTSSVRTFATLCDFISVASVFTGSVLAIRSGDKVARIFFLAWGILACCVSVWLLGNLGVLEKNYFVAMAPIAGNMTEMILMSIALAMRIRTIKEQKMIAEVKAKQQEHLQHLLRIVCHDLSNPLSVIKSVVHVAKRQIPEPHHMQRLEKASDSMESIIRQVRKYESFRSGKLSLDLKPCSVRKAFDDIEFYFADLATSKDIALECRILGDNEGLAVMADEIALLHEVLNNLVSNALKFTEAGGRVTVSARPVGDFVDLVIDDNGIGIPADLLPRIFDTEGPTTRMGTRSEGGSGFGMPLVKIFVEIFGGRIAIDSREVSGQEKSHDPKDHGTRITITLSRAKI